MSEDFVFYVYDDDDPDDPRFSFWMEMDDTGMSLYERPPDGEGKWLKPSSDSDYGGVEPSEDLKRVIAALLEDGIDGEKIVELPPHERHFVQVIHGTNVQNPDAIPGPVWSWMHTCAEEVEADV